MRDLAIPLLWLTQNHLSSFLLILGAGVYFLALSWGISVMDIGNNGIRLYRVNSLVWSDITNAKKVKFLGLPYILITRRKGMRWWLPLYFLGERPIEDSLKDKSPIGNPIREIFN